MIAGNLETTCIVHKTGKLSCWGDFLAADVSDDEEIKMQCDGRIPYPVDVPLADKIEQIDFGDEHVCLIGELEGYKGVMCYGSNRYYQLGCAADFIYCPGREDNPATRRPTSRKLLQDLALRFDQ